MLTRSNLLLFALINLSLSLSPGLVVSAQQIIPSFISADSIPDSHLIVTARENEFIYIAGVSSDSCTGALYLAWQVPFSGGGTDLFGASKINMTTGQKL